jgi:hypothetical protein
MKKIVLISVGTIIMFLIFFDQLLSPRIVNPISNRVLLLDERMDENAHKLECNLKSCGINYLKVCDKDYMMNIINSDNDKVCVYIAPPDSSLIDKEIKISFIVNGESSSIPSALINTIINKLNINENKSLNIKYSLVRYNEINNAEL